MKNPTDQQRAHRKQLETSISLQAEATNQFFCLLKLVEREVKTADLIIAHLLPFGFRLLEFSAS